MSDFKGVLIEDSRLQIKDEIQFGVMSGPAQSTYQPFQAVSISNSNLNFNINVPSENICIDRAILLDSDFTWTVQYSNVPVDEPCFNWGWSDAFAPFPMQQCFTTVSTTVNNCTTSSNIQDILSMVLRLSDSRILSSYNSGTPAIPDDSYGIYTDGIGATNNLLAGFQSGSFDSDFVGRGALKVESQVAHFVGGVYTDTSVVSTDLTDTWTVVFKCHLTEAWQCLNPWSSNYESNESGIIGVNNITFNISVGSVFPQNRFYRTANSTKVEAGVNTTGIFPTYVTNIALGAIGVPAGLDPAVQPAIQAQTNGFSNTQLLFNFLSFDPSQSAKLRSAKCVLPYIDTPRYLSSATGNPTIPAFGSTVLQTQSLQLNQVNDLIMVGVRIPMSQQNCAMSDSWLTITGVSITYNNTSGILASAKPIQLFQLSKDNSSSQNWLEFSGQANGAETLANANPQNDGTTQIPTVGSLLLLNPAKNFNLDSSLSSGSLGQFQLQMSITVTNQFPFGINPEIILVMVNSGVYITQNGQSEVQTGLLTRDMVLNVKKEAPASVLTTNELKRLVGGRMHNRGMFNTGPIRSHIKDRMMARQAPVSEMAHSGGYSSGGISSGGRLRKHIR